MIIRDVCIRRVSALYQDDSLSGKYEFKDGCVVNATDIYADYVRPRSAARVTVTPTVQSDGAMHITHDFLYILTDTDITGVVGPITLPAINACILQQLRPILLGKDPMRSEYLWEIMYRSYIGTYGSDLVKAISHVDAALWDIKAKYLKVPLYELLGGKVVDAIKVYANTAGLPHNAEEFTPILKSLAADNYCCLKIYSKYGPAQGKAGIRQTAQTLQLVRDVCGPDMGISLEAVCGWDYEYTMALARAIEPIGIDWLEEPCMPDRMDEYARLRKNCPIKISAGEHSAMRWEYRRMFELGAADYYQPEPIWAGGVSEVRRIIDMASAFNALVYLHGCITNLVCNIMATCSPFVTPMTEYLLIINRAAQYFLTNPAIPHNGYLSVPEIPGIGCDIDEGKVEKSFFFTEEN